MNFYPVQSWQTDRQTDRRWCIRAHCAICTGGLKIPSHSTSFQKWTYLHPTWIIGCLTSGLVMELCMCPASSPYIPWSSIYHQPKIEKTWFWAFDIDLWPTTPMLKIKVKGQTVQAGELGQTHKWTDGRYQFYHLPALLSLIKATWNKCP